LAWDGAGHLLIALSGGHVLRYTTDGQLLGDVAVGRPNVLTQPVPQGIAVDPAGRLYVADSATQRILVVES